jgi:putative ABC transport system permease protein
VADIDENFFSFMGFPLIQGNSAKPFVNKNSAVISERVAKKYFGNINPIGQTFSYNEAKDQLFTISAVAKDFPLNSSLQFDIMMPLEGNPYYERQVQSGTNSMSHVTLIELAEGSNIESFQKQLNAFGIPYFKDFAKDIQTYSEQAKGVDFNLSIRPY